MEQIKSSSELKAISRAKLVGNYKVTSLGFLVFYLINLVATSMIPGTAGTKNMAALLINMILSFLISAFLCVFMIGFANMFLKLSCNQAIQVTDIFYGFSHNINQHLFLSLRFMLVSYLPVFLGVFCMSALSFRFPYSTLVGSVVFCAGLIISVVNVLRYIPVFFITLDFPQYDINKVFSMSSYLMKGHMGRLFYIIVSFIPLYLLSVLTFFIGFFWIAPYIGTTLTGFYLNLIKNKSN